MPRHDIARKPLLGAASMSLDFPDSKIVKNKSLFFKTYCLKNTVTATENRLRANRPSFIKITGERSQDYTCVFEVLTHTPQLQQKASTNVHERKQGLRVGALKSRAPRPVPIAKSLSLLLTCFTFLNLSLRICKIQAKTVGSSETSCSDQ